MCVTSCRTVARVRRRPQPRRVAVEALEHLEVGELRQVLLDRRVEVEVAALDLLQRRRPSRPSCVIDAMRNIVSGVTGSLAPTARGPAAPS